MKILTCNIRAYNLDEGENHWSRRRETCIEIIRAQSPAIICFQEMWAEQLADMEAAFPDFDAYGIAPEILSRNPLNAIFFDRRLFRRISQGGYWLSETPHVAGSKSWNSEHVRLANWLRLEVAGTGKELRVINTHLDHVSEIARENGARMIVEDAAAYPESYPQLLTGDMNCDAPTRPIAILKNGGWKDTYEAIHGTPDPGHTLHKFRGEEFPSEDGKLDWVFARGDLEARDAEVIRESRNGRYPSDHYFVSAEVDIRAA